MKVDEDYFIAKMDEITKIPTDNPVSSMFKMRDLLMTIYHDGFNEGNDVGFEKGFEEAANIKLN